MDWDDAYANGAHIPRADDYPARWEKKAADFRSTLGERWRELSYGPGPRNRLDLFEPEGQSRGLAVFIHGGYWMRFDGRVWSHLAAGALARGWTVAMPTYTLAPDTRIAEITREAAAAIACAAGETAGPICLSGHSAGGHLASRMMCEGSPLPEPVVDRVAHVLSLSGVHDLRPLLFTAMNDVLGLDSWEAGHESPALLLPREGTRLTCWVGANERPEFVRQNALLANIWTGLGARTRAVEEPGRHHFDVIDGLEDADSPLTRALLDDRED